MAVTKDRPGPYAPTSAILGLVERHRSKGLPSPVDADVLGRAGISASLIPRTLQALQTLDLIGEDGKPTDVLEGIRLAPEAEYKKRLGEWLSGAYADALAYVDPAVDDEIKIRDAFRSYVPVGQQNRMVTLFMGLFTAAGVMPERPKSAPARKERLAPAMPRIVARAAPMARNAPPRAYGGGTSSKARFVHAEPGGLPPALGGLLASLPANGAGWTQEQRDKFLTTFGAVIDFCFPIVPEAPAETAASQ